MPKLDPEDLKVASDIYEIDSGGYEYRVKLLNEDTAEVIDEWDSLHECYKGSGHLPKDNARATIKEIESDVSDGNANIWFSL